MGRFARRFKKKHRRSIMRRITISPPQFNNFLFPAITAPSKEAADQDPELVVRLMRKIKSVSQERALTSEQQAMVDQGRAVFPDRFITEPVSFDLENDEHRALMTLYNANIRNFSVMAMEDAIALRDHLRDAPDPNAEVAEPAEAEFSAEE